MKKTTLLEMNNITKSFPGIKALDKVSLRLYPNEVLALVGENGAGKSTLIKILGGIYSKDDGEIKINGKDTHINSVLDARKQGISIIHQELVVVPKLTVAENIFLGREPKNKVGFVDYKKMNMETQEMLEEFELHLKPTELVSNLTIAQQQMVEIVKAVAYDSARILVMDEPTSSLSDTEVEALFASIECLKKKQIGIIYVSHRMAELRKIGDRICVLRDGHYVGEKDLSEITDDDVVQMMVGRPINNYYNRTFNDCVETILQVRNLENTKIHDINFDLKKGEILGFAGLIGAGRSETALAIFGIDPVLNGSVLLEKIDITHSKTSARIAKGIALVPENRKEEGIFAIQSVKFNLTLKILKEFINGIKVNQEKEDEINTEYMNRFNIKAASERTVIGELSGGNQQKVIMSSWLATKPKVLILDEPTRGIDIATKSEIYSAMNEIAAQGVAIIMISSELPEVINICDRVAVFCEGTIKTILDYKDATQENIMKYALP